MNVIPDQRQAKQPWRQAVRVILLLWWPASLPAQTVINEVLFNPPGSDLPNEYVELRGTPNSLLAGGTYFVVVEGDTNANPGVVQNVFDLSGRRLGGNGFLVLLQKTNAYAVVPGATALVNTADGGGFGSGSSSSIGHKGESDQTDLENGSSTFFLIQSTNKPSPGDDIDADDDGTPDGELVDGWTVLDSIGVLDNDGLGDLAYGAINFRRHPSASASGNIVEVAFTVDYVARTGNTTGSTAADWVAGSNLEGNAPDWLLGDVTDTSPPELADAPLDHIGGPNFGAPDLPGVLVFQTGGRTDVTEGGSPDQYSIRLNTVPAGNVEIELTGDGQIQLSTDGGASYGDSRRLTFNSLLEQTVWVRAVDDTVVEPSPEIRFIQHQVTASADPGQYPLTTIISPLSVRVTDNDLPPVLSELKVNPPGSNDDPFEYIEIRGNPNTPLRNVFVLAIEGDVGSDPGRADVVIDLTGWTLGSNGLLLIAATNQPYAVDPGTTLVAASQLNREGGGLGNGSISFLLLTSPSSIAEGQDLDKGDNGILEGLPAGTTILDAVGWSNGDSNDLVFGGVDLTQVGRTPDGATRFPLDGTPLSAAAWFTGSLLGPTGAGLVYDPSRSSSNAPSGSVMTPGAVNVTSAFVSVLPAFSGVIGDPTNPVLEFSVSDSLIPPEAITAYATSDNPAVVPDANLTVLAGAGGQRTLILDPAGVGYATITVWTDNTRLTGFRTFPYAASGAGTMESRFHTLITDASTAIPIPPDLMLVGDDETQILRLYRRYFSGPPVNGYDVEPFLQLTDFENGRAREVDIEASTRMGDRIYWMGSHSHANIGEIRTNRSRIFATDVVEAGANTTLTYVGRYEHLKDDLVDWDVNNRHGKGANYYGLALGAADGVAPKEPHGIGFNIEGLAMAPGSATTAWIGFRAPLVPATNRLFALIVPVTNFDQVAVSNGPRGSARFGTPIELDFQGRGIRSFEGGSEGYLIVTGPAGDIPTPFPPHDFKVYTWSGDPADRPRQHDADLTGLNPEAIVELPPQPWTPQSRFQVLSDNGRFVFYNDGVEGKQLPYPNFKKFRSDIITLGPVVRPQPFFTAISYDLGLTTLVWRTNPGDTYRLQYKEKLSDANWTDVPGDVTATSSTASRTLIDGLAVQRFFQVVLLP
jgi:hypothetical protein